MNGRLYFCKTDRGKIITFSPTTNHNQLKNTVRVVYCQLDYLCTRVEFEVLNSCHGDGYGCISHAGNILINHDDDSVTVLLEKSTSIHKQTIELHNE